ncbi:NUDIX hydrolase [Agrococcus sp. TSP3-2-1]|uniref:NUDIX hydrolase n=1 Tax=Agrococcus sp. TSP3-2-1 TaxID=2804583 RepID=UPI003CEBB066
MSTRAKRDASLTNYARPSVAVDTAVLTVRDGRLCVGLLTDERTRRRRLPGTFLHEGEVLADAVRRSLREKAGIRDVEPAQLHVFDALDRDSRGWVLSVAHMAVVRADALGALDAAPIADAVGLDFDHDAIVRFAVERLRLDYDKHPDPADLLTEPFTIAELREVHEAVAGALLQPDTFRRRVLPQLLDTGDMQRGGVGKPAGLFRRA